MCIDLKTFYASVECVKRGLDPFKTNLVVADPSRGKGALCLAISPKMKELGVKNRCRLFDIPNDITYIVALPKMKDYMEYSKNIYKVYLRYFSKEDIYPYSIDECFIDMTSYLKLYKTYEDKEDETENIVVQEFETYDDAINFLRDNSEVAEEDTTEEEINDDFVEESDSFEDVVTEEDQEETKSEEEFFDEEDTTEEDSVEEVEDTYVEPTVENYVEETDDEIIRPTAVSKPKNMIDEDVEEIL